MKLLAFAKVKQVIGQSQMNIELDQINNSQEKVTVSRFVDYLDENYEELQQIPYKIAVNEQFVDSETVLNDHDVVALIPPVSGG
ncbi:MoaD/ThiS family protein [Abyssicoccus albus]|uniref:MoaD/ThiS family protein n=1 Tax=Abyssicoccus albus TaxID=1817405 RepID=UPI00097E378A|nr:MoaD/ThiS family protein [Abyssicoccus albus]AQL56873.1 hypothetical protein BVH56_08070 [Abyssicoccus albus]